MAEQRAIKRARITPLDSACDPLACNLQCHGNHHEVEHHPVHEAEAMTIGDTTEHRGVRPLHSIHLEVKHHPVPEAEAMAIDDPTEQSGVHPSHSDHREVCAEAQQADGYLKHPEDTKTTENQNAPAIPSVYATSSPTGQMPSPWKTVSRLPFPHPGWTRRLSPSFTPMHSTPPEISKWAKSPSIRRTLDFEQEKVADGYIDGLHRAASIRAAMMQLDNFDFPGFCFPYGAWGMKRPLKNAFLPRRPMANQRSKLCNSAMSEQPTTTEG